MRHYAWNTVTCLSLVALGCAPRKEAGPPRISEFGRYEGYSQPMYTDWVRTSHYVTMRDGVRLASRRSRQPVRKDCAGLYADGRTVDG